MKTKKILVEMPADWEEQLSTMNDANIGTTLYEILGRSPLVEFSEDAISRESLKSKLKEHHDFFVNAYGGFNNLPLNDKSRVDEITNCIAMVVNEPSVTPKQRTGHWIDTADEINAKYGQHDYKCSKCGKYAEYFIAGTEDWWSCEKPNYCPYCGAKMVEP